MIVFVDVDDTLMRSVGSKRIPMPLVVKHVRELWEQGAELYCWSSGGAAYARESAEELGLTDCFLGFLPKPQILIDDQEIGEWRRFATVHPNECGSLGFDDYARMIRL